MTDPSQINNSLNQQLPTNGKQLITAAILRVALTTGGAGLLGLTGWIAATFAGLTSNNTFTGSNTHTGPEVFTGSVVLPAGTITGSLGYTPAHSGANSDIFSINGLLTPLAPDQGGTGLIAFIKAGSTNTFATSSGPFRRGSLPTGRFRGQRRRRRWTLHHGRRRRDGLGGLRRESSLLLYIRHRCYRVGERYVVAGAHRRRTPRLGSA